VARYVENIDDYEEFDFALLLAAHLADGEVAVAMEAGAEKLRYVNGFAFAVNAAGDVRSVSLDDIYALAEDLGPNVTVAQY
jgi:transcriptional antiterminator Rof (Rho-off)